MSKCAGIFVRPSKRVEEWETVDDISTARERVKYWAQYVTEAGFGERFGFRYEAGVRGYKVLALDRSIPEGA
ncbi:hypothetical protein ACIQPR_43600 [Streptomyces sp. NPDC091280]|uniref:hypothetical protein n=1 Tax=Streptomyces sp. NPDC091280 TaxID=3365984 RepID=UPI0037F805DD